MLTQQQHDTVWELIQNIKTPMLVTQDGDSLRSRPMRLVQDQYQGTLWFFTNTSAAKVFETNANHQVCLSFADTDKDTYVSLSGKATISRDQEKIERFWNPAIAAWFEDDKYGPEVSLLEITVEMGEFWQNDKNIVSQLYELVKANFTDEQPDMGQHKKLG